MKLMRSSCSEKVQVKAAGGVRDLDGLIKVRDLGGTRCGATATVAMLDEYRRRADLLRKHGSKTGEELIAEGK
jgi:deoxyribose-phosphate aldolase